MRKMDYFHHHARVEGFSCGLKSRQFSKSDQWTFFKCSHFSRILLNVFCWKICEYNVTFEFILRCMHHFTIYILFHFQYAKFIMCKHVKHRWLNIKNIIAVEVQRAFIDSVQWRIVARSIMTWINFMFILFWSIW